MRQRRTSVRVDRLQGTGAIVIDLASIVLAVMTIVIRAVGTYEALLLLLLARPMWDFVRVLREMGGPDDKTSRGK